MMTYVKHISTYVYVFQYKYVYKNENYVNLKLKG